MPRDAHGIIDKKWASTPGVDISTPTDFGITDEADGFPVSWSQSGGQALPRRLWNWFFRRMTAFAVDVSTHGILEWDAAVAYVHPAYTVGSDGRLYRSERDSLNVNPVADTDFSHWKPVINSADGTAGDTGQALTANDIPNLRRAR